MQCSNPSLNNLDVFGGFGRFVGRLLGGCWKYFGRLLEANKKKHGLKNVSRTHENRHTNKEKQIKDTYANIEIVVVFLALELFWFFGHTPYALDKKTPNFVQGLDFLRFQVAIYTVCHEESESEVNKCKILEQT